MKSRLSQKETIFYVLYKKFKEGKGDYVPVFHVMGETYCEELKKWGFVSYECSARLSEMFKENPGLIQRHTIAGKSGARYFGYRINPSPSQGLIKDDTLLDFHASLTGIRPKSSVSPAELAEANRKANADFDAIPGKV